MNISSDNEQSPLSKCGHPTAEGARASISVSKVRPFSAGEDKHGLACLGMNEGTDFLLDQKWHQGTSASSIQLFLFPSWILACLPLHHSDLVTFLVYLEKI